MKKHMKTSQPAEPSRNGPAAADSALASDSALRVAVLIPTFRRPVQLEKLLVTLADEVADCQRHWQDGMAIRVIVIDNDVENQAGAAVAQRLGPNLGCEYEVLVEATAGVSVIRNRLVGLAMTWQADLLQMIDDDEYPAPGWLRQMVQCAIACEADIVSGPVRAEFEVAPPEWVVEHYQFEDRPHETGTFPAVQRTSNVMFRSSVLKNATLFTDGEWFNIALGRTGGEDSHLIERLVNAGAKHVWCEEAAVHEHVPAERLEPRYLRQRAWRYGNCGMVYRELLHPGPLWTLIRLGKTAFLAGRWLLLSYRYLIPSMRELHHLELCIVRGRVNAHLGRVKGQYGVEG